METIGEQVYRIHKRTIDNYVSLFLAAEDEWKKAMTLHTLLDKDYPFVATLDEEYRICFWVDKFTLYKDTFLRTFLKLLEVKYCRNGRWHRPYFFFTREEQELMFVVNLYLVANPGECQYLHRLTKNVFWQFNFLEL